MSKELKPWQKGYPLEFLKKFETLYGVYNAYADSPFAKIKKNDIALHLSKAQLVAAYDELQNPIAAFISKQVKVKSNIYMFPDVLIGTKEPGDIEIKGLTVTGQNIPWFNTTLNYFSNNDVWIYSWVEDSFTDYYLKEQGFSNIGAKITTFGEIMGIYFREKQYPVVPRNIGVLPPDEEFINVARLGFIESDLCKLIYDKVKDLKFENHYSNYNEKKAWSAVSLRGYTPDPQFITKPSEMSDKWQDEHKGVDFKLQDTLLYHHFPEARGLVNELNSEIHRVRFMKLIPGGGELSRHTDLVDKDCGKRIGQLLRIHYPIKTNRDCIFTSWDANGIECNVNMREGEYWMLDTRFPHKVINFGREERIHLVVDVVINEQILSLLKKHNTYTEI